MMNWLAGNRRGFTALDALITLSLIAVLIGVVVPKYQRIAREAQETALKAELVNIRTSIRLFQMLNNRNPRSLKEMMEKRVMLPARLGHDAYSDSIFKEKYLLPQAVDEDGNVLDSFGNRFEYDHKEGEVRTTTEGYGNW